MRLENVTEAPIRVKGIPKARAAERATRLLDRVGLAGKAGAYPGQLSEMAVAREAGDWLVFMDDGVVVEAGRPPEVPSSPQHERTRAFLSKVL